MEITKELQATFSNMIGVECTSDEIRAVFNHIAQDDWKSIETLFAKLMDRTAYSALAAMQKNDPHAGFIAAGESVGIRRVFALAQVADTISSGSKKQENG